MKSFINDVKTAFDNKSKQNTITEVMSHIELMFGICTSADRLCLDEQTEFFDSFVLALFHEVSHYRNCIEDFVNKKISEVSDKETE